MFVIYEKGDMVTIKTPFVEHHSAWGIFPVGDIHGYYATKAQVINFNKKTKETKVKILEGRFEGTTRKLSQEEIGI